jgi:hypothetical protein
MAEYGRVRLVASDGARLTNDKGIIKDVADASAMGPALGSLFISSCPLLTESGHWSSGCLSIEPAPKNSPADLLSCCLLNHSGQAIDVPYQ